MNNKNSILTLLFSCLLICLASLLNAADRPNLLFIMMDDMGYGQCQFHNSKLTVDTFDPFFMELVKQKGDYSPEQALEFSKQAMPTINRLADEGVVFTRAYSPSNLCASARISIATARNQQYRGIYVNVDVEALGPEPGSHLAHQLQNNGYGTAHIGKWHIGRRNGQMIRDALDRRGVQEDLSWSDVRNLYPEIYDELWDAGYYGSVVPEQNPLNNGFDYYYGYNNWASEFYDSTLVWENYEHAGRQAGYNTEVFTDKALGFMEEQVEKKKPFYVQLHYHAVHGNLRPNAPSKYFRKFPSYSYDLSNFYAHVYAVDYNIQRILDYLKKKGALDNTLIVFTSDNGGSVGGPSVLPGNAPYSGHKGNLYQGGTIVPLVFSWPAGIRKNRVLNTLASSMDILPTFLDAAGVEIPSGLDGQSLLPLLTTRSTEEVRDHIIWAGIHAARWGFLIHKSYENHWTERWRAPPGWAVIRGDYLLRFVGEIEPHLYYDYPDGASARLELFNVSKDPAEKNDLAEKRPKLVRALKDVYLKHSESFKPPITWPEEKWKEIAGQALK